MVSMIQIRPAVTEDAAGIAPRLAELTYATQPEQVTRRLADLQQAGGVALVAVDATGQDPSILGLVTVQRNSVLHRSADDARISSLVVAEHARGQGIGRRLIAAAEDWAKQHGCARIEVTSGNARTAAHAFYRHLGYEQTSQRFSKVLG